MTAPGAPRILPRFAMIDYDARRWINVIFRIRGSILPRLAGRTLFGGALGVVAAWSFSTEHIGLASIAHTMIGVALGLLLVFRTNASYDRYWEGRRLLGNIVIRVRDLSRQASGWAPGEAHREQRERLRSLGCAYYRAVAQALRSEKDEGSLARLLPEPLREEVLASSARPHVIMVHLTRTIASLAEGASLHPMQQVAMDQNLTVMTDAFAGCERIVRTPVPFAYAQHIKLFVVLFCYSAPFTMSETMGWFTPLASMLVCFALFGIDEIGVEIEDPFGRDDNDLPLDEIGESLEQVTEAIVSA